MLNFFKSKSKVKVKVTRSKQKSHTVPQGIHTSMCNMRFQSLLVEKLRPRLSSGHEVKMFGTNTSRKVLSQKCTYVI